MALGVENSLKVIADVEQIVVDSVSLVKGGGFSIFKLGAILAVVSEVQALVGDAKGALPELADIDPSEAGKLTEAAYSAVKAVIMALAQK